MTMHTTKDGRSVPISEMGDDHLRNTILYQRRRASDGVKVQFGFDGGSGDCYYDVDIVYGQAALSLLNHGAYVSEAKRRKLQV